MTNPWVISEADAKVREAKALADEQDEYIALVKRIYVPGMPDAAFRFRLARRGYDSARLRRILEISS